MTREQIIRTIKSAHIACGFSQKRGDNKMILSTKTMDDTLKVMKLFAEDARRCGTATFVIPVTR